MNVNKQRQLVIFDMDGLMFDTERLSHEAWMQTAKEYGFHYSMEITRKKLGLGKRGVRQLFEAYFGMDIPIEKWHNRSHAIKRQLIDQKGKAIIKPGLLPLLEFLEEKGILTAIASSSDREMIEHYLELTEIHHHFDYILSGDQVTKSKPDPEIFLKTCQAVGMLPEAALILEDSASGSEAAQRARIPLFFVRDLIEPTDAIRKYALGVFNDLTEVKTALQDSV